jgi:DNA-binding NarL/FixJ family response regulator
LALEHLVDFLQGSVEAGLLACQRGQPRGLPLHSDFKILIINDDTMLLNGNAKVIQGYFKICTIHTVENPEQAFEIMRTIQFDYIFCDINFDNSIRNGYEFTREVRKNDKDIKMYLVSSTPRNSGEAEAFRSGAHGYIEQLMDETKLKNALEEKEDKQWRVQENVQLSTSHLLSKIFHDMKKPYVTYSFLHDKLPATLQKEVEELAMNFEYATNLLELLPTYLNEKNISIEEKPFIKEFEKEFNDLVRLSMEGPGKLNMFFVSRKVYKSPEHKE